MCPYTHTARRINTKCASAWDAGVYNQSIFFLTSFEAKDS